jgi:hypothetical protein
MRYVENGKIEFLATDTQIIRVASRQNTLQVVAKQLLMPRPVFPDHTLLRVNGYFHYFFHYYRSNFKPNANPNPNPNPNQTQTLTLTLRYNFEKIGKKLCVPIGRKWLFDTK